MSILIVGFDSAWTKANSGAIVGVERTETGEYLEIDTPAIANFDEAKILIQDWQERILPTATVIMVDQPTIVANANGQRPAENIASSAVSLRYGGMQPANAGRAGMFSPDAPIWPFLASFGGAFDPLNGHL